MVEPREQGRHLGLAPGKRHGVRATAREVRGVLEEGLDGVGVTLERDDARLTARRTGLDPMGRHGITVSTPASARNRATSPLGALPGASIAGPAEP